MYFMTVYPNEIQIPSPELTGISGHKYHFDFLHGNKAVLAVNPHPNAISSALKKIIDLNQTDSLVNLKPFIVIDDRRNPDAADNETKVLSVVAQVMKFTMLESKAKINNWVI